MEVSYLDLLANLLLNAKTDKFGILTWFNVCVQRELDGMANNVWLVEEAKSGTSMKVVSAQKDISLEEISVSSQPKVDAL